MPGACGPHPKKGLVPYSSGWWDGGQIPSSEWPVIPRGEEVSVLLPAASCQTWGLYPHNQINCQTWGLSPYHEPKKTMWNPAKHSYRHSTANKPTTVVLSFKQSFSKLNCQTWGLSPYHEPKKTMWNPAKYSYGHSTANKPTTVVLSFKQSFSKLNSKSLLRSTSDLLTKHLGRYHETTMLQPAPTV